MPGRLPFNDTELASYYELKEVELSTGHPALGLRCKKCPAGKPAREYELELVDGAVKTGDRNALLAHATAHSLMPTLRRKR
jgi:hypothetical protein